MDNTNQGEMQGIKTASLNFIIESSYSTTTIYFVVAERKVLRTCKHAAHYMEQAASNYWYRFYTHALVNLTFVSSSIVIIQHPLDHVGNI